MNRLTAAAHMSSAASATNGQHARADQPDGQQTSGTIAGQRPERLGHVSRGPHVRLAGRVERGRAGQDDEVQLPVIVASRVEWTHFS